MKTVSLLWFVIFLGKLNLAGADRGSIPAEPTAGERMLDEYFEKETRRLSLRAEKIVSSADDWGPQSLILRRQLYEMLGLQPLPARSPLKPVVTGMITHDGVVVEKLYFQSRPGLYVTANFYRPEKQGGPFPAILYVCGHAREMDGEISLGNKAHYQHHPLWFVRNGYTCLVIDSLQLGEIEGIHHGTHHLDRWWWNSRGYTPAGVEAWNGIRALDYLETRPEVDRTRLGVTGRSGGGAYTCWIAALDERVKVAVPVAGITSLKNHVVDGCIEGHCDCMFMVNTYRWDFPLVTALIAPRPLLILNTDQDEIFPADGVADVYAKTARVYERLGKRDHIGLTFHEGPHADTGSLRVSAFRWFERHLKGKSTDPELDDTVAKKEIAPTALRVFDKIPGNERNTAIDEYFTRLTSSKPKIPATEADWKASRALALSRLKSKSFRGWPAGASHPGDFALAEESRSEKDGMVFVKYAFTSQAPFRLPLYLVHRAGLSPAELDLVVLNVLDEKNWGVFLSSFGEAFPEAFPGIALPELIRKNYDAEAKMHRNMKWGMLYFPPRGIGPTAWTRDQEEATHIRRRFALLGQTLDGMRLWDIRRGIQAVRTIAGMDRPKLWIQSSGTMGVNALYAALYEPRIQRLDLHDPPFSHRTGPEYLNVLRFFDIPEVVSYVAKDSKIRIYTDQPDQWNYPLEVAAKFNWEGTPVEIRKPAGN